jgi:hypothetical protein
MSAAPPHKLAPLFFFGATLLCQLGALSVFMVGGQSGLGFYLSITLTAITAFLLSSLFKLPLSWRIVNSFVGPSALLYLYSGLSASLLLIPIGVLALIYLPTFWTRVPYYPTSNKMYEAILAELPTDREFSFIDLGSGFGSLLFYLQTRRRNGKFYGSEISPLPYLVSKARSFFSPRVSISGRSFWSFSLSDYDYVYAFLAPGPMPKLWGKVQQEMKPGSSFLVNSFEVPAKPLKRVDVRDDRECVLLIYDPNNREAPKSSKIR